MILYRLFLDSIRSLQTLRRYKNHLHSFLKLIPNQFYSNSLGKTPKDKEVQFLQSSLWIYPKKVQASNDLEIKDWAKFAQPLDDGKLVDDSCRNTIIHLRNFI